MEHYWEPGIPVRTVVEIKRVRGDGNIPVDTMGIVCWADDYRGYATVQFVGRITDHFVPLSSLEIASFQGLTTPSGV